MEAEHQGKRRSLLKQQEIQKCKQPQEDHQQKESSTSLPFLRMHNPLGEVEIRKKALRHHQALLVNQTISAAFFDKNNHATTTQLSMNRKQYQCPIDHGVMTLLLFTRKQYPDFQS
mmetsp:Transcript_27343/g.57265  ORF Transcript_27343/g.57265 Transcript_27343/m.57265 type:complete len:116 (-) Transcript_27343:239-586(-)